MYNTMILNVDELWLKGKNRPVYWKAIKWHVRKLLKAHSYKCIVQNEMQRIVVKSETILEEEIITAMQKVPGLSSVCMAVRINLEYDEIFPAVKKLLEEYGDEKHTFKIETKRSNKQFPVGSMDTSRNIGGDVLANFDNFTVDVKKPEIRVDIRVLAEGIYISTQKIKGIGGLPVGTSGHLVTLISGGFDSPVASYMMSKRGCKQTLAFFYSYPFVGEEVKDKIIEISKVLSTYQCGMDLYIIPFGKIQKLISKNCREEYRTILFRKYMIEISDLLAKKVGAQALLTGDALGQVSSQTIGNMKALDSSTEALIQRPLIGFNKAEIISLAKQVGTHDVSVIPHDDACSLFAPKHPVITPDIRYWKKICEEKSFSAELEESLENAEIIKFNVKGEVFSPF